MTRRVVNESRYLSEETLKEFLRGLVIRKAILRQDPVDFGRFIRKSAAVVAREFA